eukprot:4490764-Pleurochrysis_carterae.AAC.1
MLGEMAKIRSNFIINIRFEHTTDLPPPRLATAINTPCVFGHISGVSYAKALPFGMIMGGTFALDVVKAIILKSRVSMQ